MNVDTSAPLGTEDTAKFRSAVGIALYISADRVDVSFAVRVLASGMAKPTKLLLKGVIRLTQYLLNTLTYAMALKPGARGCSKLRGDPKGSRDDSRDLLEVFTDSDWSGNRAHRRSMGSATHCINGAVVFSSCRSQKSVSLSSMEAEWYTAVSASCDGVYLTEIWEFLTGTRPKFEVLLDNASARALAHRQGAAKAAKHIAGRLLWLQHYVREGVLEVRPVPTAFNLGDIGTKVLSKQRLLALSFMHDFVEGDVHRPVGEQDYGDLLTAESVKKTVKQVKSRVKLGLNLQAAVMISMMSMVDGAAVDSRGNNHNFMFSGRMVMVSMLLAWALGVATQTASSLNCNSLGEMVMTIVALLVALCETVSKTASLQLPMMMLVGLVYHMYQKVEKKIDYYWHEFGE